MANTKISQLPTWTGNTTGFYLVVDNSGLTQTYKVTKETLGIFEPEIILKTSSVDQTVTTGNNISFDVTNFNLNMTSPGAASTLLKANRTYELRGSIRLSAGSGTGSEITYRWYDNTNAVYLGVVGGAITTDANWTGTDVNEALAYFTVGSSDVVVVLKVTSSTTTPLISTNQSRVSIKRVA